MPLLALGGPPQAANLQLMGMDEHIAVMLQLAEPPRRPPRRRAPAGFAM